ncbi:MAG: phenylalanine--tRNA ligase subunit alpha [Bdellovibrionaceae bacterium]|nr:phenylalanine--tRNA ligase subunit alpha [Pseudobdellovibrionaceae bacterium]
MKFSDLSQQIEAIHEESLKAFKGASSSKDLYDLKVEVLGKKGKLSLLMGCMAKLSNEDKPKFGNLINIKKKSLEEVYLQHKKQLDLIDLNKKLEQDYLDMSLPGKEVESGALHPIQKVSEAIVDIFSKMGFSVRTGKLIEEDYYNFEALNIPKDHPSRDMQDTFYIDKQHVLRTHTSPIQVHTLETEAAPLRVIGLGAVFRSDSDISHSPNFYQIEGLFVDKKVSMAHLKGTVSFFVKAFFNKELKTRFRPSFFPFTEPSVEVDCQCSSCMGKGCSLCGQTGWIEIGGCGLVNPKVLKLSNVNQGKGDWQAYAFGFGLERMAILKYGIKSIRYFSQNDIRFLSQFK